MEYLKVNTIYPAYMGECNKYGIGVPCTFIRLNGCNLRCYLKKKGTTCDTPEALECDDGKRMEVSSIIKSVRNIGNKVICLTGGEPLLQDCTKLLTELVNFIKFVIDDEDDLDACKRFIESSEEMFDCNFAVGLFWGSKISYKTLMNIMPKGNRIYLNMQAHKMQCMYDKFKGTWEFSKIVVPREL